MLAICLFVCLLGLRSKSLIRDTQINQIAKRKNQSVSAYRAYYALGNATLQLSYPAPSNLNYIRTKGDNQMGKYIESYKINLLARTIISNH